MKKWKRVLGVLCIMLLITTSLSNYQKSGLIRQKNVKAACDSYHNIEIDGVTWRYEFFRENINQNPKHHKVDEEDIITCVEISLENTNGHTEITIPDTIEGCPVYRVKEGERGDYGDITLLKIPITVEWIDSRAFFGWKSLKEVKFLDTRVGNVKEISEEEMYFFHIGDEAFACCESLVDIPINEPIFSNEVQDKNIGEGIYRNCKGLKKLNISSKKEKVYIPPSTFKACGLEDGIQVSNNVKELFIAEYGFWGCNLKKIEFSCNCVLGANAFAENKELQHAEFKGDIRSIGESVFKNSFCANDKTELVFYGEDIELSGNAFGQSKVNKLSFLNPNGTVKLKYHCIFDSLIEKIEFKNKNVIVEEGGLDCKNKNLSEIIFENSDTTHINNRAFYSGASNKKSEFDPSIKKIVYQCRKVVYEDSSGLMSGMENCSDFGNRQIIYGTKVEKVSGMLGEFLSKFGELYIENPKTEHEVKFQYFNPRVYGYSAHKEISPNFTQIQKRGLIITYEDSEIINTKGIDLKKLHVFTELKTGNKIEIPTGKIIGEKEIPKPEIEEGYLLRCKDKISNYEGILPIKVYYQDTSDDLELPVVPKRENKIQVEWSENYGNNLIEGQNIDLEQLVDKVKVYYNDGSCIEKDEKALELVSKKVVKGENSIVVCLKGYMEIRDSFQCMAKENQIERVVASYNKEVVYLGDEIELDKINLRVVYTLEDDNKNTNLSCKKISKTTFDLEGKNIIRVYYTDELYSDMEVQVKVPKPVKVEAVYKEGYPCYGVHEEIKQEAVEIFVTLENQKVLTNAQLEEPFTINIVSYSEKDITAAITYKGIKSNQFKIPLLENKIISISPILCKESVLEGSLIGRELISCLKFSYENGTSELVKLDDLDQTQLQISEGYLATAKQWNTINITYMGIQCNADVWGEEDNTIALDVQYWGKDIEIGKVIHLEDCKVYLVKKSGKRVLVTEGITIINPVISKVGENLIYFCYGTFQGNVKVNGINNGVSSEKSQHLFSLKPNHNKIKVKEKIVYSVLINKAVKFVLEIENLSHIQYQFVIKGQKINTKKWKDVKKNSFIVKNTGEKYGILYIRYTLPNGNINTVHTTGFCIDTIAPKTNIKKNQYYKKGKKVQFSDNYGVKWAKLDGKKIKSGTKIKKAGKHILVVMDKAGNKISIPFSIL